MTLFPKGEARPKDHFTGETFLYEVLAKDHNGLYGIGSVSFEAGARTHWHTHPKGQVLIITAGKGWYQEAGKAPRPIQAGDVVDIAQNIKHWHGARADSAMTHLAITHFMGEEKVVWLEAVSDAQYQAAHNA